MGLVKQDEDRIYLTVLSDGTLRQKVQEDTPGATKRTWELRDGTTGEKWELIYKEIEGLISEIKFFDGEFGQTLNVTFVWEDGAATLQLNTSGNFATDFLKKAPNLDLSKPVRLRPFSFTSQDTNKPIKGVSLQQQDDLGDWEKVPNFFFDPDKKVPLHGFPEPSGNTKKYNTDDWKVYFIQVKKFLIGYCEQTVIPKVRPVDTSRFKSSGAVVEDATEYDEAGVGEVLAGEEVPF